MLLVLLVETVRLAGAWVRWRCETCTSDQAHPMGVKALIASRAVALILLVLPSLLGVVSLFLCESLMSWKVIFSEFNKEASLYIAII